MTVSETRNRVDLGVTSSPRSPPTRRSVTL